MTTTGHAEKVYRLDEAAEVKSVSRDTLLRALKAEDPKKSLAGKRLTSGWRIKASDLDDWWDRQESL